MDRQTGTAGFNLQGQREKDPAASPPRAMKAVIIIGAVAIGLVGLWLTSRVSYLLFHSLAEMFSVLVAWGMFIVAWNSRRFITHSFFLFLGTAFLAVGSLDLLHMLAYKGMGVFPGATSDLATQLWIAARSLEAGSLLLAPLFLARRVRAIRILSAYSLATALLLTLVFVGWFPACFVEGQGLTPFKIISEYLICVLLAGAIFFVYRRRQHLDPSVLRLVVAAAAVSIVSELSFTLYVDVYGLFNQLGHFLKIVAYVLLYKAIIETGLQQPYRTLFRELAQINAELHQSREWFRVTLTSIGDGVIAADKDGRITFSNSVAAGLTGWQPEESLGQPIHRVFEIINEKTGQPAEDIVARVLSDNCVVLLSNNTALVTRDGRQIPIEDSAAPILDADNNVTGVVLVFHDVTEKRHARVALAESEKRYRTLFETMTEGFALHEIICDDQGRPCDYRFLQVNPAFERLTGLKATDLLGRTLYEVLPQSESLWVERYGSVALTGQPAHFDQRNESLGRHYEVSAFQTERGFFGVVFIDITERKQAEEFLRTSRMAALNLMEDAIEARREAEQINAELESRVKDRTAKLTEVVDKLQKEIIRRQRLEDTLRESEKQVRFFASQALKAQEKERKKIAAELHDSIAASLAAIKFTIEKTQEEMKQGLATPDSLQNLVSTVQQTIGETRRIMADLRPSILDDLGLIAAITWFCREFQKTYSHIAVDREIGLSEGDLPDSLKTPIFRISQEALNNIAKHSLADRVNLSLRKEGDRIQLAIQDNGQGFDVNKVAKGFGLSTMRERAELSEGTFTIESGEGETVIRASWPLG